MKRKYKPFLIYSQRKGWAYYPNNFIYSFTSKSIGLPVESRKAMRKSIGWFLNAEMASIFENRYRKI